MERAPRFPNAHYVLGEIFLARDRFGDAKEESERALWEDEDHALKREIAIRIVRQYLPHLMD